MTSSTNTKSIPILLFSKVLFERIDWHRKISAPIAALLYEFNPNINPNSITIVSSAIGVVGAGALILSGGDPTYAIIGASLVQASSVADGIDGDYSRYLPKEKRSDQEREFGGHLDTMFDRVVDASAIYNHIFEARLREKKGRSDFAIWLEEVLGEKELAKQIEDIDSYMFSLEGIREKIIGLFEREKFHADR